MVPRNGLSVPAAAPDSLTLGDIALGREQSELNWLLRAGAVPLNRYAVGAVPLSITRRAD